MGPWTHGIINGHGSEGHNSKGYKIRVMKTQCITHSNQNKMTHNGYPHIYRRLPQDEMVKVNTYETDYKLSKFRLIT